MTLEDQIIAAVEARLADPAQLCTWAETLYEIERKGRIEKSRKSRLDFILCRLVGQDLATRFDDEASTVVTVDDVALIVSYKLREPQPEGVASVKTIHGGRIQVGLPDWLFEFFDDEEHALLLDPRDTTKLMEVIQQIYEFCLEHGYIARTA